MATAKLELYNSARRHSNTILTAEHMFSGTGDEPCSESVKLMKTTYLVSGDREFNMVAAKLGVHI